MKILILKPSSLGDVVQALPVLRLIKQSRPDDEIFWWIDSHLAPLLEGDPDLTGLVRFERRRWASPRHWPEMWQSIRWMRAQKFGLVIDLQCLSRSGAFAWLANGAALVGLDEPREGARGFYDRVARRPTYHTHAVDWYLAVLEMLGIPVHWNFEWMPERANVAREVKRKWQTESARWIVLQPGARWANKRWPVENFSRLVQTFGAHLGNFHFAILGNESDKPLGATIAAANPGRCLDLTGKISLPQMVEWIRLCDLMISNDTGPMHVAAALHKPVVALFGPTEPRRTGPYGQLDNVLQSHPACAPCMTSGCANARPLECLHLISPREVMAKVEALLKSGRPRD